jgi:hypothetical protein
MASHVNLFLAIKEYDLALLTAKANIIKTKESIDSYVRHFKVSEEQSPEFLRYERDIDVYNNLKQLIEIGNYELISDIIKRSEEYSKKSYFKNFRIM